MNRRWGTRLAALVSNGRAAAAGLRDGRRIRAPVARSVTRTTSSGRLEDYFDANTTGPGIWKWRHYFPIYERHLARFAGTDAVIVEIGIYSGGSLPMWREYFGERATIVGVDIEPACRAYEREGVRVVIGDQADPGFWADFRREFPRVDVLIDDGGHAPGQQITTLREMLPHMQLGGVFVCEDVAGSMQAFHSYVDAYTRPIHDVDVRTFDGPPNHAQQHVAAVHRYPIITVIEKPELPVANFSAPRHGTEWQPFLDDFAPPPAVSRRG
jgi:hypothetical protein